MGHDLSFYCMLIAELFLWQTRVFRVRAPGKEIPKKIDAFLRKISDDHTVQFGDRPRELGSTESYLVYRVQRVRTFVSDFSSAQ